MENIDLKHIGEMATVSEVINALDDQGYSIDFNLRTDQLNGRQNLLEQYPERFVIDAVYRFEGESDPDDEGIVYAISSQDRSAKGILVDGYGLSSENDLGLIIKKLDFRKD